jgi:SPX domain
MRLGLTINHRQFYSISNTTPLHIILPNVPAIHVKFFDMLDAELTKVEAFYLEREKGMHEHAKLLKRQLHELEAHRQMFYVSISVFLAVSNAQSSKKPSLRNHLRNQMLGVGPREFTLLFRR